MITRASFIAIIARLIILCIILLIIFYSFDPFNALQKETDTINFIIYGIYAPFFFIMLTITICLILAVPFWLSKKIKRWWNSKPFLQILILLLGVSLLLLSSNNYFRVTKYRPINGEMTCMSFANELISLPGWFLIAISLLIIDTSKLSNKLYNKILKEPDWTK